MDSYQLPDAIEPDYWNVVFHPSETALNRLVLGRFQHVSAFTYLPGFRAWLIYDVQWSGMRLAMFSHGAAMGVFIHYTRDCTVVKFDRVHGRTSLASRAGFYCVPAIKQLLGLSCVAVTPDGLYRHLINNGGSCISEPKRTPTAAAGSDASAGATAGAG